MDDQIRDISKLIYRNNINLVSSFKDVMIDYIQHNSAMNAILTVNLYNDQVIRRNTVFMRPHMREYQDLTFNRVLLHGI